MGDVKENQNRLFYITVTMSSIPLFVGIWNGEIFQNDSVNMVNLAHALLCSILIALVCLTIGILVVRQAK